MNRGGSDCQKSPNGRPKMKGGKKKHLLQVATYNTRSISDLNAEALDVMLHELKEITWSVIGLSETKVKESKIEVLEESKHKLFLSGNGLSRSNGVGFLVNKKYVPLVQAYQPISDRLSLLTLKEKHSKITFIQCYMPTSDKDDQEVEKLYDEIQAIIKQIPKRDHLFVMGDFNCKVGKLHSKYKDFIGKHAPGNSNERGEMLAKFCIRNDLVVTNTLFQKRKLHTWISPDGKTKNQIDFILTRKSTTRLNVLDSNVLSKPDISDHLMVRTKVRLNFTWPKKETRKAIQNLEKLKDLDIASGFQIELKNRFSSLSELQEPEELYNGIVNTINDTAKNYLDPEVNQFPNWMTNESKNAIKQKHKVRKESGPNSDEYRKAKAVSKRLVKRDKLKKIEVELDTISALPPTKQYFAAIKRLKTKPKNINWGIRNRQGKLLTDKDDILERWAEYYENLYKDTPSALPTNVNLEEKIPSILKVEVENAIKLLKPGKSPGLDNIFTE